MLLSLDPPKKQDIGRLHEVAKVGAKAVAQVESQSNS